MKHLENVYCNIEIIRDTARLITDNEEDFLIEFEYLLAKLCRMKGLNKNIVKQAKQIALSINKKQDKIYTDKFKEESRLIRMKQANKAA